jgi:hypothetical protein
MLAVMSIVLSSSRQSLTMHLVTLVILCSASFLYAAGLEERQPYPCYLDRCLAAVNGTRLGSDHPVTARNHCSNYMTTTVVVDPTYAFHLNPLSPFADALMLGLLQRL